MCRSQSLRNRAKVGARWQEVVKLGRHRYKNTMDTPANIELVCLPLIPNVQAMSIEINRDATIYHLKEKIKAAYTSNLNGVGEADLLLYALKDQDADQITASQILANPAPHLQNLLSTLQTVAECFPTIPVQKFHVLIRIPGMYSYVGIDCICQACRSLAHSYHWLTTIPSTLFFKAHYQVYGSQFSK